MCSSSFRVVRRCEVALHASYASLYSDSALVRRPTGSGKLLEWFIISPIYYMRYPPVILPLYQSSCQLASEKVKSFLVGVSLFLQLVLISSVLTSASNRALLVSGPMPWTSIGDAGKNSDWSTMWTHTYKLGMTLSQLSKSLVRGIAMGDPPPCTTLASLARWRMPYMWWARRTPEWAPLAHGRTTTGTSTVGSNSRSRPMRRPMTLPTV
jgi:hypothetical protein